MKTTLNLPDALVREVELRASHEGRALDEMAADLLRLGLATHPVTQPPAATESPVLKVHPLTQLPYFECAPGAPASRMTAEQLVGLEQATQTEEDLDRLGLPARQ